MKQHEHMSGGGKRATRILGPSILTTVLLAACGGAQEDTAVSTQAAERTARALSAGTDVSIQLSQENAVRLAQQATFGPTEALVETIKRQGAVDWIQAQMNTTGSVYTSGGDDSIHTYAGDTAFCDTGKQVGNPNCFRDYYSNEPLNWDFYRNAIGQPDQLRQRVALALQQINVISATTIQGTYGLRVYHNGLLDLAFGNYRDILRHVILSPVMGDYLNHANNDRDAPNENFARELLQLFSVGPCRLQGDGQLAGGKCRPTYDNQMVRNYAFALTGWTYPKGGDSFWGCWPKQTNCRYYGGRMVGVPALHNDHKQDLLGGTLLPSGTNPSEALEVVLDSLMTHPNLAPFVAKRLIQHLVVGDPSPEYIRRVAETFKSGTYSATSPSSGPIAFGKGRRGDLQATVAAILLDDEARGATGVRRGEGKLREPILLFTGTIRALNGVTDGGALGWWWGDTLRQHVFRAPSVFNFYPPDYPVPGTRRIGPVFGIHNSNAALNRLNYLTYLFDWGGSEPDPSIPKATGTKVRLGDFTADAGDAAVLVDRLSLLVLGRPLAAAPRTKVIDAVSYWKARNHVEWRLQRVKTAAYLVMASPDYQVQP